jgi:hypothetical protein
MKVLLTLLLAANGVAWVVAQGAVVTGTYAGAVSGAESLETRQGR